MHTGTQRKMPAKLAGARRASREGAFPTQLICGKELTNDD